MASHPGLGKNKNNSQSQAARELFWDWKSIQVHWRHSIWLLPKNQACVALSFSPHSCLWIIPFLTSETPSYSWFLHAHHFSCLMASAYWFEFSFCSFLPSPRNTPKRMWWVQVGCCFPYLPQCLCHDPLTHHCMQESTWVTLGPGSSFDPAMIKTTW